MTSSKESPGEWNPDGQGWRKMPVALSKAFSKKIAETNKKALIAVTVVTTLIMVF